MLQLKRKLSYWLNPLEESVWYSVSTIFLSSSTSRDRNSGGDYFRRKRTHISHPNVTVIFPWPLYFHYRRYLSLGSITSFQSQHRVLCLLWDPSPPLLSDPAFWSLQGVLCNCLSSKTIQLKSNTAISIVTFLESLNSRSRKSTSPQNFHISSGPLAE